MLAATRLWRVDILIDANEDERVTHAEARLQSNSTMELVGRGTAHRPPDDVEVAAIGVQLAAARALVDLSHELIRSAASASSRSLGSMFTCAADRGWSSHWR